MKNLEIILVGDTTVVFDIRRVMSYGVTIIT